jgi:hypothetical protein
MAYVETNNIKFTLTTYGKEEGLKRGLLDVMKYFTVSDNGVIYTMNVQPKNLLDVNGSHGASTNVSICDKNIIE